MHVLQRPAHTATPPRRPPSSDELDRAALRPFLTLIAVTAALTTVAPPLREHAPMLLGVVVVLYVAIGLRLLRTILDPSPLLDRGNSSHCTAR
ncbi:hypothetical protein [Dietzia sp. 179-F 9C3 NHS]|uniref:hypothetical protein n=1 Tax=Dietzia sp. 179-F 9C3 NHS TaxID=3374295 RepID=UPI003879D4D2